MKRASSISILAAIAAGMTTACAKPAIAPIHPHSDLIVLLPDPGSNTVGRVTISNREGSEELSSARETAIVAPKSPPRRGEKMSESEVRDVFGDALAALPPPPLNFTLFFRFDSEELTDDSFKLTDSIKQKVRDRAAPEIVVVGHTDTTGTARRNVALGIKRAMTVRALLIETGVNSKAIKVTSHGEVDPLVPTGDEVFEPRNRRVEITVR